MNPSETNRPVNNDVYDTLGERWYTAQDDPVALLRAESRLRNPWIVEEIGARLGAGRKRVLDVGCGAGFLANDLAKAGYEVTGVDASVESLQIAARYDATRSVRLEACDARALPFGDGTFDAACAMDFLEHVDEPERIVAEIGRVLAPGGLFFFHTFNRNPFAWLVAIKGVEWFVKNTPHDLHVLHLFRKPSEVAQMCKRASMRVVVLRGVAPKVASWPFLRMLATGIVPAGFEFRWTCSTLVGYTGIATKEPAASSGTEAR